MKLVIFGASGGTGMQLVQYALREGHNVRAVVRSLGKLASSEPELEVKLGDALDSSVVDEAVRGADAVISLIGLNKPPPGDRTVSNSTRNIVAAMEKQGVRRFISVSMFGLGDSLAHASWLFRWIVRPLFLKNTLEDRARQEEHVQASRLEWTLVRPTHLVEGPATGRIKVLNSGKAKLYDTVSRADVAEWVLKFVSEPSTHRRAIVLGAS